MLAGLLPVVCPIPDSCEDTEEGKNALIDETVTVGPGSIVLGPTEPFGKRSVVQSFTPSPWAKRSQDSCRRFSTAAAPAAEWKGNRYSNQKLHERLGWKPRVNMRDALSSFLAQFNDQSANRL